MSLKLNFSSEKVPSKDGSCQSPNYANTYGANDNGLLRRIHLLILSYNSTSGGGGGN